MRNFVDEVVQKSRCPVIGSIATGTSVHILQSYFSNRLCRPSSHAIFSYKLFFACTRTIFHENFNKRSRSVCLDVARVSFVVPCYSVTSSESNFYMSNSTLYLQAILHVAFFFEHHDLTFP